MKLFARDALLPTGWAHDVVVEIGADGIDCRRRCRVRDSGRGRARAGSARSRHAERAFPCFPARARGADRARRTERGQLLGLAPADVSLPRAHRAGRAGSGGEPALSRTAQGRLHQRGRVPLSASRSRGKALCEPGGDGRAHPRRGSGHRHRAHPAAGFLRAFRFRRCAAAADATALHPRYRHLPPAGRRRWRTRQGETLGIAPHSLRAVLPAELAELIAFAHAELSAAPDSHPCRRTAQGGRRLHRLERRAARGVAARTRAGRSRAGASCTQRT